MKKLVIALCAGLMLVAVSTAPASAIINGAPDGDRHPYVGIMYTEQLFCSGAAISPTVFLTADHCIEGATEVYLSFDENPQPRYPDGWPHPDAAWTTGTVMQIGEFCGREENFTCPPGLLGFFSSSDVAVVIMDEPVDLARYAQLPDPDQVETLRANTELTAVGYGVDAVTRGGGVPQESVQITRKYTTLQLAPTQNRIDDVAIRVRDAKGSTCSGDSGSPLLLGDTVLAVLSGGNGGFCGSGQDYYSRVDNEVLPLLEALV